MLLTSQLAGMMDLPFVHLFITITQAPSISIASIPKTGDTTLL